MDKKTNIKLYLLFSIVSLAFFSCTNIAEKYKAVEERASNSKLYDKPITEWVFASDDDKIEVCYVYGEIARLKLGVNCSPEQVDKDAYELKSYLDSLTRVDVVRMLSDTSSVGDFAAEFYMYKFVSSFR